MADWTGVDSNSLLPGKPVTSSIMLAAFEDPIAIAEGAVGAPPIARKYLAGSSVGGATASVTFTDLGDWGGIEGLSTQTEATDDLTISFSDDGSTFVASTAIGVDFFKVDFSSGAYIARDGVSIASGTIAGIPATVTDVRITSTTTDAGAARLHTVVSLTGGDTTA